MKDERSNRKTDAIYERDSYLKDFSAEVISCEEIMMADKKLYAVILDITAFFPEGGGQPSDTGIINGIKVVDVQNVEGDIVHYMESPVEVGSQVACSIDFEKRYVRMQNHSAEHVLCGLIHNAYGYENVGFHLTDEAVTLDVDGPLTDEQIKEVELRANEVVYENVLITVSNPSSEELEKLDYRSKLEMTENVRLVSIGEYDVCACCAPHVNSTGEIGVIHVVEAVPHRGGTRITMLAGFLAYSDYAKLDESNRKVMALVSSKRMETAQFVEGLDDRYKKLLQENVRLKKQITELTLKNIMADIEKRAVNDNSPFIIFACELDDVQLRNVINDCVMKLNCIVAGFLGDDINGYRYIASASKKLVDDGNVDLRGLAKLIGSKLNGRGGGSNQMIQGQVASSKDEIERFFNEL